MNLTFCLHAKFHHACASSVLHAGKIDSPDAHACKIASCIHLILVFMQVIAGNFKLPIWRQLNTKNNCDRSKSQYFKNGNVQFKGMVKAN